MEKMIREIIDSGILRYAIDRSLQEDVVYTKDLKDAEQIYASIEKILTDQNEMLLDDYAAVVRSANARAQELAFLAGVTSTISYLKQMDVLKIV